MSIWGSAIGWGAAKAEGDLAWSRQKRMMKNRHQWEVDDLRAAGLNPILSAGGAPSMASPQAAKLPDLGGNLMRGQEGKATRKKQKVERGQIAVAIDKLRSDITVNTASSAKMQAETRLTESAKKKMDYDGVVSMMGIIPASVHASVAGSASGQAAAKLQPWQDSAQTIIQGLIAAGLLSRGFLTGGSARGGAKNAAGYPRGGN